MAAGKARPEQIGGMITKFKATARRARRGRQRPVHRHVYMGGRSSLKTSERRPVSTCFIARPCRCRSLSAITPELRPDAFRGRCLGVFVIYIVALSFVKQSAAVVAVLPPMLSRPC
jgi:hypothetical protein